MEPTPTPQAHVALSDPATTPCLQLRQQMQDARQRLLETLDEITAAEKLRDAYDKEAGQWHDLEHEAQKSATDDLGHKPSYQEGKSWKLWNEKHDADEGAVKQARDVEARLTKLANDEQEKIRQLHDEQARLRMWLTEAEYQSRTRCVEDFATADAIEKRVWSLMTKVVAGVAAFGLVLGSGLALHARGDKPADLPEALAEVRAEAPVDIDPRSPRAPKVSGSYAGDVAVVEDPAGHKCCVKPGTRWDVLQRRDTSTGAITIQFTNVLPGITLEAPIAGTGAEFKAETFGAVAGFKNVQVELTGTVTIDGGLNASLVVGRNRSLPQGKPIYFRVDFSKTTGVSVTPV